MKRAIGLVLMLIPIITILYHWLFIMELADIFIMNIILYISMSLGFIPMAIMFLVGWFLLMDKEDEGDEKET